jgi:D-beta-D-heptose 7-phosphate kinase / D-beta-D-heptose 1-phosphate adenosyltransferase
MSVLQKFFDLNNSGAKLNICVVGDAMVDEYYDVKINRISPEFPIPICSSANEYCKPFPGGAANVAYQFKHFAVNAKLATFVDAESQSVFNSAGIESDLFVRVGFVSQKIPRKKRFYSEGIPIFRWDVESKLTSPELNHYCNDLFKIIQPDKFDVVIFSDYNKGVFSGNIHELVKKCSISIVDPKTDINKWYGCTVFKPNAKEALALSGRSTIKEAAEYLFYTLSSKAVVITESENGVSVFDENGYFKINPLKSIKVKSVIGAGDCFTAFLAMAVARGMTYRESAEVAFNACSIYVTNDCNKPIGYLDLCGKRPDNYHLRNRDFKLVMANGCFDILHAGHIELLRFAKQQGDKLVVAVNSDASISRLKAGRPFITLSQRIEMLAALEFVDYVISFDEDTPLELIMQIQPDTLVKGAEYQVENIVGYGIVDEIKTYPMVPELSTTKIFEKIKAQMLV